MRVLYPFFCRDKGIIAAHKNKLFNKGIPQARKREEQVRVRRDTCWFLYAHLLVFLPMRSYYAYISLKRNAQGILGRSLSTKG